MGYIIYMNGEDNMWFVIGTLIIVAIVAYLEDLRWIYKNKKNKGEM